MDGTRNEWMNYRLMMNESYSQTQAKNLKLKNVQINDKRNIYDEWNDGEINGRMNECMDEWIDGWLNEWMDVWMNGWTNE